MAKFLSGDVVKLIDHDHPQYERLNTPPADGSATVQTAKAVTDEVSGKKNQFYACVSADGKCEFDAAEDQLAKVAPAVAVPAGQAKAPTKADKSKADKPASSATPKTSW